jgi:4-amino-4-deoxy-L-arabinose transferase-like glycosyltransferase
MGKLDKLSASAPADAAEPRPFAAGALAWRDAWIIAAVVSFALAVRFIYIAEFSSSPFFSHPIIDGRAYYDWAKDIVSRSFFGDTVFFQNPLYPYFLAGLIAVFGAGSFAAYFVVQTLVGAAAVVIIYYLAKEAFDKRVALLAALLAALYRMNVYYDVSMDKTFLETMLANLTLLMLLIAVKKKKSYVWLLAGVAFGLTFVSRGNFGLILPFLLFWIWRVSKPEAATLKRAGIFLAGAALMVIPVTIRNAAVSGQFVLVTSHTGLNLWIGNNPANRTGAYEVPETVRASPKWERADFLKYAAEKTGKPDITDSEASSFYTGRAVAFAFENTSEFLDLTWKKILLFIGNHEIADNHSIYFDKERSTILSILPMPFAILFGLCVMGMVFTWSRRHLLFYIFIFSYSAAVIVTFVFSRYRMPVVGVMAVFAASGVVYTLDAVKNKNSWKLFWPALGGAVACFLSFVTGLPAENRMQDLVVRHQNLVSVYLEQGKYNDACAEIERMRSTLNSFRPDTAEPDYLLAKINFERGGRYIERALPYARAAREKPTAWLDKGEVRVKCAEISATAGKFEEARDEFIGLSANYALHEKQYRAGFRLFERGLYFGAIYALAPISPYSKDAEDLCAEIESRLKIPAFFKSILEENPNDLLATTYLGLAIYYSGNEENGIKLLRDLYVAHPEFPYSSIHLFHVLVASGNTGEAAKIAEYMRKHDIEPYPEDAEKFQER